MNRRPLQVEGRVWGPSTVRLLAWLVEPGETVVTGEPLAELAQPGIVGYLESPCEGVIRGPLMPAGEVTPDLPLGWIEPV